MTSKSITYAVALVAIVALSLPAAEAAGCECLGVAHPNATRFGAGYGSRCAAYDLHKSTEFWPTDTPGLWSCQSWCYVNKTTCNNSDVAASWDVNQTNLHFSWTACPDEPKIATNETCPWIGLKKTDTINWTTAAYDPCTACSGDKQSDTAKFSTNYGSKCDAWDGMKCGALWPTYKPGGWCCDSWCYISTACPSGIASWNGKSKLSYSYDACKSDAALKAGCPWIPNYKGGAPKWTKTDCSAISLYKTAKDIVGGPDMITACKTPKDDVAVSPTGLVVDVKVYNDATCGAKDPMGWNSYGTLDAYFPALMNSMGLTGWKAPVLGGYGLSCFDAAPMGQGALFGKATCPTKKDGAINIGLFTDGECTKAHAVCGKDKNETCVMGVSSGKCTNQTAAYQKPYAAKTVCSKPAPEAVGYRMTFFKASGGKCMDDIIGNSWVRNDQCTSVSLKGSVGTFQGNASFGASYIAAKKWIELKMGDSDDKCPKMGETVNCKTDGTECCPISGDINGKAVNFAYSVVAVPLSDLPPAPTTPTTPAAPSSAGSSAADSSGSTRTLGSALLAAAVAALALLL